MKETITKDKQLNDILLKSQTLIDIYLRVNLFIEFEWIAKELWEYTDEELNLIWKILNLTYNELWK